MTPQPTSEVFGDDPAPGSTAAKPEPPDAAASVLDAVERQDTETLRALGEWALDLAEWREAREQRDVDPSEAVDDDEQLVDAEPAAGDGQKGTIVTKKVPCGKDSCSQCPHGPYNYRAYRDGDTVRTDYLGPADSD